MKNKHKLIFVAFVLFVLNSFLASAYFNYPANNQYVSAITKIEFTIENAIEKPKLFIDEKEVDADCNYRNEEYRCVYFFDTINKDGEHLIETKYVDSNGQTIIENITIIANNEKISVFLDSPKEGETIKKNPLLKATASENAEFVSFEYSRDNINWKKIGLTDSDNGEFEWDLEDIKNNNYILRASAFNNIGAKAYSNKVNVKIEKPTKKPMELSKYKYLIIGGIALIIVILIFIIIKRRRKL